MSHFSMGIEPGRYIIKNAASWTTMDESTDGQHTIHGWQQTSQPNQYWELRYGKGVCVLQNIASGSYLHVEGWHNGSKIVGASNSSNWYLHQQPDGSVLICTSAGMDYVVDLDNGYVANGTAVHLWERNTAGAKQQQWFFEKID